MNNYYERLLEHQEVFKNLISLLPDVQKVSNLLISCLRKGGKILFFGNGGSAADAQHFAAELVGRFKEERIALPAIALTTDTSILTALSNDYSFANVFGRQIQAFCKPEDAVIGISTSGNSENVLEGIKIAKNIGALTIALTGKDGGKLKLAADICLCVPSNNTPRIQEAHGFIGHVVCEHIENAFLSNQQESVSKAREDLVNS